MTRLRYGTRGSALALAQSSWVARELERAAGAGLERVVVTTSGDVASRTQPPDAPAAGPAPNFKAMFVKEIEEALLAGAIDFAVHSAKDLPGELPEGLEIVSVPAREDPRDVFVPGPGVGAFAELPAGAVVATGSSRRQAQLRLARPDLRFVPLRGNVDTRLRRLDAGDFAGVVLAAAGLKRLGLGGRRHEPLPASLVVAAPGQGALALEARADRPEIAGVLRRIEDRAARLEFDAERALLAAMGGGCQTPLGCLARVSGARIAIEAFWSDADGGRARRRGAEGPAVEGPALARRLADELRS